MAQFELPHGAGRFEIPDEWLNEAGANGFSARTAAYPASGPADAPLVVVPFVSVAPPARSEGVELFERERLVSVLEGLVTGAVIPAIEAHPPPHGPFLYAVRNGYHRFYASAALGFTHIPLVVYPYFDFDEWRGRERSI